MENKEIQVGVYYPDGDMLFHSGETTQPHTQEFKSHQLDKLTRDLKAAVIKSLLNENLDLDTPYAGVKGTKIFSRRELAKEIEDNTEVGINMLSDLIMLTLFQLSKACASIVS